MNKKKIGYIFVLAGLVVLLGSVFLYINNRIMYFNAVLKSKGIVAGISEYSDDISEKVKEYEKNNEDLKEEDILSLEFGETKYIGYIHIPKFEQSIPVKEEEKDSEGLDYIPYLYFKNTSYNNMLICDKYAGGQLEKLKTLEIDDEIDFIDILSNLTVYKIKSKKIIYGYEELMSSEEELTFAFPLYGKGIYVVVCERETKLE